MTITTNERGLRFKIQQLAWEIADESLNLDALQDALQHHRTGQTQAQIDATRWQIKRLEVLLVEKKDELSALKQVWEDEYAAN